MLDEIGFAKAPDLSKIFDLYNAQTSIVNTLWNFYIVVALGILGFIYKGSDIGWKIKIEIYGCFSSLCFVKSPGNLTVTKYPLFYQEFSPYITYSGGVFFSSGSISS